MWEEEHSSKTEVEKMELNKEELRYAETLYRCGMGSEEIIDDMIVTLIRPKLSREVKMHIRGLKQEDIKLFIGIIKEVK